MLSRLVTIVPLVFMDTKNKENNTHHKIGVYLQLMEHNSKITHLLKKKENDLF